MKPAHTPALFAICLSLALGAAAQNPLKDIRPGTEIFDRSSEPNSFVTIGSHSYFQADTGETSIGTSEKRAVVWKTDGTAAGTVPLLEGPSTGQIFGPFASGSQLFFFIDSFDGHSLWVSDGTPTGTRTIAWFEELHWSENVATATVGGLFYFRAATAVLGHELWRTDGTEAGTVLVADIVPGAGSSYPQELVEFEGDLLFTADDGIHGRELWRSSGSPATTAMVVDFLPGPTGSDPRQLTVARNSFFGDRVYFTGTPSLSVGRELCRTDGDAASTYLLKDINPGSASSSIFSITVNGLQAVFSADDGIHGHEPWTSGGATGNTNYLRDIRPGSGSSNPSGFTPGPGGVYFAAEDDTSGRELWFTNTLGIGTLLERDVLPGPASSNPYNLSKLGDDLVFSTGDGLWRYDGTVLTWVDDVFMSSRADWRTVGAGQLLFAGKPGSFSDWELWRSDGTPAGTYEVLDLLPAEPATGRPGQLTRFRDRLFFTADDGIHGREIWFSDGTLVGTQMLLDIWPGVDAGVLRDLYVSGDQLFFSGNDGVHGRELWTSDGTAAGTRMLRDVLPGSSSSPILLGEVDGIVYFDVWIGSGRALWKSDGTAFGTQEVFRFGDPGMPESINSSDGSAVCYQDKLYFVGRDTAHGYELWSTDGTASGTSLVLDLVHGPDSALANADLIVFQDRILFVARSLFGSVELWKSDGTSAGTVLIRHINPGLSSFVSRRFTVADNTLYFIAETALEGRELWRTDGTAAGTRLVSDIAPGSAHSSPHSLVAAGDSLYFTAFTPATGRELYKVNGATGTAVLCEDLNPGPSSSSGFGFPPHWGPLVAPLGTSDRVLYTATDGSDGHELYRSDGTAAGTYRLLNIAGADPRGSEPSAIVRVDRNVFYTAKTQAAGRELHMTDLADATGVLAEEFGDALPGINGKTPAIGAVGDPVLGNAGFQVELSDALPGAQAALVLSVSRGDLSFGPGCTLYPAVPHAVAPIPVDGLGAAAIPIPLPNNPSFIGLNLYAQWVILDPGGCYLNAIAASAGLRLMLNQ